MNIKLGKKINEQFFYGYVILFFAIMSAFFSSPGQTYSISAFSESYIQDFGFSRTAISSIYFMATFASGMLMVFVGKAVDKYGQRKMALIVGTAFAVVCFLNSFITNMWMIAISFFCLRYLGQGSMTLIPGSLTPQWFDKRRAFAMSISNLGGVLGNLLVPALNVLLITRFSWQFTWRVWSILLIVIFLPIAYLFIINKPEDIDALPDGEKAKHEQAIKEELIKMEKTSWTLQEAMKTKAFWFVGLIAMLVPMISTGLMFHFFSIMDLKGIDETSASFVIGLVALPGLLMPIISGLVIDRFRSKHILSVTALGIALALVYFNVTTSLMSAIVFMIVYGFVTNIQNVTIGIIWPRYFGRKYLGSIRGAATVFMVLGSSLGTLPFGLSFDLTGSYKLVLIGMAIISIMAMILALSIKKPQKIAQ